MTLKNISDQMLKVKWKSASCFSKNDLPAHISKWLLFPGSFTNKISKLAKENEKLKIVVLNENLQLAKTQSYEFQQFSCHYFYIREVQIFLGNIILMYAKSLMPKNASVIYKQRFRSLGQSALGKMLFSHSLLRSPFQLAKISPKNKKEHFSIATEEDVPYLWGRRSIFSAAENIVLLNEFFSSQFIELISNREINF